MNSAEVVRKLVATGKWSEGTAELGERARFRCEYCDLDLLASPENYKLWQVDHIVPRCKDGTENPENLAIACKHCNWDWKRDWDPREKAGMNCTRTELIQAVREYVGGPKHKTGAELSEVCAIVGYPDLHRTAA